jgi:hypothetical protein
MRGHPQLRLYLVGAAVVALAFALAACSSGTTAAGSSTAATTTSTSAAGSSTSEVNPSGDIPDNQVFIAFQAPSGDFTVQVPEGWAQTQGGGATMFTDKLNSIRIEEADVATAPSVQSVQADVVPGIASVAINYEAGSVEAVQRTSGEAILVNYRADGAPDSVTGKVIHLDVQRYEFWKAGKLVTLTLSGPQGADNVDPWRIVTDSLRWLR